ncbi:hypothetical protein DNTS_014233, partial [Danionella cerebrum]
EMPLASCVYFATILMLWFSCESWGNCIFDNVQSSVKIVSPPTGQRSSSHWSQSMRHKRHLRSMMSFQPIRIKTWIPVESPALSEREKDRLTMTVDDAVNKVSRLISVRRASNPLLLNRDVNKYCKFIWRNSTGNHIKCARANDNYRFESCLGVVIPDEHLDGCSVYPNPEHPIPIVLRPQGPGLPDTDFLLYVLTHSTDKCKAESSVVAYAAYCQTDSDGRPLAGTMVVCRDALRMERYTHEHFVLTVIHELFHVLGFSKELFSQWKDCSLSSQDCWFHGQVTNADEMGQIRLYSPNVIREMQKHFNSSRSDLGAPLENKDAGSNGLSSHWEARVLQGSIMAASLVDPSVNRIDPITLAALEDTGWYSVNLSQSQSLVWGEGEGSQFGSVVSCQNPSHFFCTGSGLGCHYLLLHKGQCLSDQYLDGCHIFKPLKNASECWKKENARSSVNDLSGEIYGSDSRCFMSNLTRLNNVTRSTPKSGQCYRHRCTRMNQYQIQVVDSDWMDCPAGEQVEVPGYQGFILCPENILCKYSDVAPPTSMQTLDDPHIKVNTERNKGETEKDPTFSSNLTYVFSGPEKSFPIPEVLSIVAVFFLLFPTVFLLYRKYASAESSLTA